MRFSREIFSSLVDQVMAIRLTAHSPPNLQGICNESLTPPWDSKYTININIQMNYWPAEPANLGKCVSPFQTNPTVQLSKLVNNLKTVPSRLTHRYLRGHLNRIYRKAVFSHRSYCLISRGGTTIEILRKYIEEQGSD
jgi:hypothetical protein